MKIPHWKQGLLFNFLLYSYWVTLFNQPVYNISTKAFDEIRLWKGQKQICAKPTPNTQHSNVRPNNWSRESWKVMESVDFVLFCEISPQRTRKFIKSSALSKSNYLHLFLSCRLLQTLLFFITYTFSQPRINFKPAQNKNI